jgi:hypothetical protein
MKERIALLIGSAALSCAVLAGCGGGHHGMSMQPTPPSMPTPPPSMTMNLDTAAVLAIVQTKTSEIADPFAVDGDAVTLTPAGDETSSPISVDAT